MNQFEFVSAELSRFQAKIDKDSTALIAKIIKAHSPIQIGECVDSFECGVYKQVLQVSKIKLCAVKSWGFPGDKLSFAYEGLPLKKDGSVMKNRKPIRFSAFRKDGKKYHMPSYNRLQIATARMFGSITGEE